MKKRICIVIFIFLFSTLNCFAQNFELKTYSDYNKDFRGVATAIYIGNINNEETEKK